MLKAQSNSLKGIETSLMTLEIVLVISANFPNYYVEPKLRTKVNE
jgi:hypothetical protein